MPHVRDGLPACGRFRPAGCFAAIIPAMTSRRPLRSLLTRIALAAVMATTVSAGQEPVDRAMLDRIRQEGTEHSKAGAYFDHFVTVNGPRLTGSPAHKAA